MKIVLASTSRYRRELIARLGLPVATASPPFDEDAAKPALAGRPIEAQARALARGKAESLAAVDPDALVIGADQIAEIDGAPLGKPGTEAAARAQLRTLAGRTHRLVTALAVCHHATARVEEALDVHTLAMRALSDAEIADYVRRDRPFDCAGSYRVESLGIALFERVSGEDFTAVIGLPLTQLVTLLARFGVRPLAR